MKYNLLLFLWIAGTCMASSPMPVGISDSERPGWKIWSNLQAISSKIPEDPKSPDWISVLHDAHVAFAQFEKIPSEKLRDSIKIYVSQFGLHGPHADLVWMLGDVDITMGFDEKPECSISSKRDAVHGLFAEMISRRLLVDSDFRNRYYHCALWINAVFPNGDYRDVDRFRVQSQNGDTDCYWLLARKFICLAVGTQREDLFLDKDPAQLRRSWKDFEVWFNANVARMALAESGCHWKLSEGDGLGVRKPPLLPPPKLSTTPFPDWNGPPLPRKSLFVRHID